MRLGFSLRYATRSLRRGGQRTLLAVFCIAVGVMAIVGLQLASETVREAITSNARAVNQGDITVGLQATPLQASDLGAFRALQEQGIITAYTPTYTAGGVLQLPNGARRTVTVRVVDPGSFPLVGAARLSRPAGASVAQALDQTGGAVAPSSLVAGLDAPIGATLRVLATSGLLPQVRLAGIVPVDSATWTSSTLTVSAATWEAETKSPVAYQTVHVTTAGPAQTQRAIAALRAQFPLASFRTTDDVLRQAERAVQTTRKFLVVIGLVALLIGGVGIANTLQVLLSRRRVEIAMLKTSGYRRRDLYLIFALEAALLGLAGGALGALLGIGVAAALRALFVHAFPLDLPFAADPGIIGGGVAIGLATALIFGILPIVRAAAVRPLSVLRDLPDWQGAPSRLQSAALILLWALLFWLLATAILGSLVWAAAVVFGGFALLLILSALLGGVVWLVGKVPVPNRVTARHLLLVIAIGAAGVAVSFAPLLRGVGVLLCFFALIDFAVAFLPPSWRLNVRLALRNIGRTRARTTGTLLALLIGVFAIGLILILGQDLRTSLGQAIAGKLDYNLVAVSIDLNGGGVAQHLSSIPGLQRSRISDFVPAPATVVDGTPVEQLAPRAGGRAGRARQQLRLLSGLQGYDLARDGPPDHVQVSVGRNLTAADAATNNVIVQESLQQPPLRLKLGSTVTLKPEGRSEGSTFTVVGFYRLDTAGSQVNFNLAPVFGPRAAAEALANGAPFTVVYLQVAPKDLAQAAQRLQQQAPDAIVLNLEDFLSQFEQVLSNVLLMLSAIASLALFAGVIVVANAVALAILERRREIGILKSVGYTSGRVLNGVLLEYAVTAGIGGLLGIVPVSLAVAIFNRRAGVNFGVAAPQAIIVVAGVVVLTTVTAALVAIPATRARPLAILRYE